MKRVVAAVAVVVAAQFLVDLAVVAKYGDSDAYKTSGNYFDVHWLPLVLIPEIVLLIGLSVVAYRNRRHARTNASLVVAIALVSTLMIVPLDRATNHAILHGVPYPRSSSP